MPSFCSAMTRCARPWCALGLVAAVAGCVAPADPAALARAEAALERARSAPRVRALAAEELERAELALEQATAVARTGAPSEHVDHLAYVAIQQAALAEARADGLVARSEIAALRQAAGLLPEDELARPAASERAETPPVKDDAVEAAQAVGSPTVIDPEVPADPWLATTSSLPPTAVVSRDPLPAGLAAGRLLAASSSRPPLVVVRPDPVQPGFAADQPPAVIPAGPPSAATSITPPTDPTLRLAALGFDDGTPSASTVDELARVAARVRDDPARTVTLDADFTAPDPLARTEMERRVELVRAALLRAGVESHRIAVRTSAPAAAPAPTLVERLAP
jgi:hypothetical protein